MMKRFHLKPTAVIILETPRLVLRHLEPTDVDALFLLYSDPEIRRYFPDGTRTFEQTKHELEWFARGHPEFAQLGLWATVERSSGALLGRCGLLPWEIAGQAEVELAYLIDKSRWGEGLASEAAAAIVGYARSRLGLSRLICLITPGNVASMRVAAKVGMSFEREHEDALGLCHIYSLSLDQRQGA
jgi:RimJ/RimL family protein N-acetyltransferase